jgi:hypothetical protein
MDSSVDRTTLLMESDMTQQTRVVRYVSRPIIQVQESTIEVQAFWSVLIIEKQKSPGPVNDIKGYLLAPFSNSRDSLKLESVIQNDISMYQAEDIVNILAESGKIASSEEVVKRLGEGPFNRIGALSLIYHQQKYYWLVISSDQKDLTLLDSNSEPLPLDSGKRVLEHCASLVDPNYLNRYVDLSGRSEVQEREFVTPSIAKKHEKSNSWFDYMVPSHPEFFVGRQKEIENFFTKINDMYQNNFKSRGIVVDGPSGSGKSSFIFKLQYVAEQPNSISYIYSVDSRGCFGPDFLAVVFRDFLNSIFGKIKNTLSRNLLLELMKMSFASFNNILFAARQLSETLRKEGIIAVLFFDQFEYLTPYPTVVSNIASFQLDLSDYGGNIVIGYVLRSDMNLPRFSEFPFDVWSRIQKDSWHIQLGSLEEVAERELISEIEKTLNSAFQPDFVKEIQEFSKGRPWVLKRIGAHLINKYRQTFKEAGSIKLELRLEELFAEDVRFLTDEEKKS